MPLTNEILDVALSRTREALLAERSGGHWEGRLSSSALSTATAAAALAMMDRAGNADLVSRAVRWLTDHANSDGGWGDTVDSPSNVSTTVLGLSALRVAGGDGAAAAAKAAEQWIVGQAGGMQPRQIVAAIARRYGADKTFSVPILTMAALAGLLGPAEEAWRLVPALPFELAALPHWLWKGLRLPVVSYAMPALIAIGQVRHHFRPTRRPIARLLRRLTAKATRRRLQKLQPPGGGFLEAAPLTAFVTVSLAAMGLKGHPVAVAGADFLRRTVRDDGSWPIDTNLAIWVTTLSINALSGWHGHCPKGMTMHGLDKKAEPMHGHPEESEFLGSDHATQLRSWLLDQQHRRVHPFTQAAPGGWGWTDLAGAVPDGDDTAGALLALRRLGSTDERTLSAAAAGAAWLARIQNRDGGIPTFCRGWGLLPFDRSSSDLTAHAIRAWRAWRADLPATVAERAKKAERKALAFLQRSQRADGSWTPLWFGSQSAAGQEGRVYGTARVLEALNDLPTDAHSALERMRRNGLAYLLSAQQADGGWGGDRSAQATIEETALAVSVLAETVGRATCCSRNDRGRIYASNKLLALKATGSVEARRADDPPSTAAEGGSSLRSTQPTEEAIVADSVERGAEWLIAKTDGGRSFPAAPIGLYFARLWYSQRLYPVVFTLAALGRVKQFLPR